MADLKGIIAATKAEPTIVNDSSKFVVVTYWWGSGNLNNNTARPCISFYEDLFNKVQKICVDTLLTINQVAVPEVSSLEGQVKDTKPDLEGQLRNITKLSAFYTILKKKTEEYYNEIYSYLEFPTNSKERCLRLGETASLLEGLKNFEGEKDTGKTPRGYTYKDRDEIYMLLLFISTEFIRLNKADIISLYEIKMEVADIKTQYLNRVKSAVPLDEKKMDVSPSVKSDTDEIPSKLYDGVSTKMPAEEYEGDSAAAASSDEKNDRKERSRSPPKSLQSRGDLKEAFSTLSKKKEEKSARGMVPLQIGGRQLGEADMQLFKAYKEKLDVLSKEKSELTKKIKFSPRKQNIYAAVDTKPSVDGVKSKEELLNELRVRDIYQNKSLNEILVQEMRYLNPLDFKDMLANWEKTCAENNCNYMAVEYPEFAKPGGYQMAINAKPLFIQKCLELCRGKSVLYIDGDMRIRKYPKIFDLPGVDYMARGWHVDPRSSYKLDESITYDPYTFETSGGTMFFSTSPESLELLQIWITTSASCYQVGKADDRIISLIFNSRKLLLKMKIYQLPIEYLWLTLDYNDRLIETDVYDYNFKKMDSSIFIDHPECLTSEDTAASSGACNDREPCFYCFIEGNVDPVSEQYFEHLAFPDKSYVEGVKSYHDFMSETYYLDDGNKLLYEKGFVEPGRDVAFNEQPLYITSFDKKYGAGRNELSEAIISRSTTMATEGLYEFDEENNLAVIINGTFTKGPDEDNKPDTTKILALIYKLLSEGKDVLYNPKPAENGGDAIYKEFIANRGTKYKNTEFAFVPIFNESSKFNDIYRPKIDLTDCMYFKSDCEFMKKFITMFESLKDMSDFINYGSYQFVSSVRVSYLVIKKQRTPKVVLEQRPLEVQIPPAEEEQRPLEVPLPPAEDESAKELPPNEQQGGGIEQNGGGGGCAPNIDFEEEYLNAIEMPIDYISGVNQNAAGKKHIKRSRKRVRFSNKRSRKQRK
jgi:hypothetical protein